MNRLHSPGLRSQVLQDNQQAVSEMFAYLRDPVAPLGRTLLLVGPPGVGKSMLAQAISGAINEIELLDRDIPGHEEEILARLAGKSASPKSAVASAYGGEGLLGPNNSNGENPLQHAKDLGVLAVAYVIADEQTQYDNVCEGCESGRRSANSISPEDVANYPDDSHSLADWRLTWNRDVRLSPAEIQAIGTR